MRLAAVLAVLVALAGAPHAAAKPRVTRVEPPSHVLFVGNSYNYYNNSLHGHVRGMAQAADSAAAKSKTFKSMTLSGGYLAEHDGALPGMLRFRKWDVVVLQGQSTEPMGRDAARTATFREYARKYDQQIRESGARTAFFMTWAYQDKPEMTAPLARGYEEIGNELGALVIPVGLAFERAIRERPSLMLHFKDKEHPSMAGTYLAAATFYGALYGTPVGNAYTADLEPDTVKFLQGIAWETVQEYYGR